jgi:hypothetical protein
LVTAHGRQFRRSSDDEANVELLFEARGGGDAVRRAAAVGEERASRESAPEKSKNLRN